MLDKTQVPIEIWITISMGLGMILLFFLGLISWFIKRYLDDDKEQKRELAEAVVGIRLIVERHDADIENIKKATKL